MPTAFREPAFAQCVACDWQQLHLPIANGFLTDLGAAQRHDLAQLAQCRLMAEPAKHYEAEVSLGRQVRFSTPLLRLLHCRPHVR